MKILAVEGILLVSLFGITGCQCHTWGDRYSDLIDDISDYKAEWDGLYNPCFDISRLGKPDWCHCKWNRLFCPHACETTGYCSQCDAEIIEEPPVELPQGELELPQGELQANPPQKTRIPPALPLERPPAPGKLRQSKPTKIELPLELPPKPWKKAPGREETFEE